MKYVVCLFDISGVMGEPWREAGYGVINIDIQGSDETLKLPGPGEAVSWKYDITNGVPKKLAEIDGQVKFACAFPPCTHLAVSGARWFKGKGLRKLSESIAMFATAADYLEQSGARYFIENPVSTISTYWRKPDYTFHPWFFNKLDSSSSYTKKTCLWVGGGFVMPPACVDESLAVVSDRIIGLSGKDKYERSLTPKGFAIAVFQSNN